MEDASADSVLGHATPSSSAPPGVLVPGEVDAAVMASSTVNNGVIGNSPRQAKRRDTTLRDWKWKSPGSGSVGDDSSDYGYIGARSIHETSIIPGRSRNASEVSRMSNISPPKSYGSASSASQGGQASRLRAVDEKIDERHPASRKAKPVGKQAKLKSKKTMGKKKKKGVRKKSKASKMGIGGKTINKHARHGYRQTIASFEWMGDLRDHSPPRPQKGRETIHRRQRPRPKSKVLSQQAPEKSTSSSRRVPQIRRRPMPQHIVEELAESPHSDFAYDYNTKQDTGMRHGDNTRAAPYLQGRQAPPVRATRTPSPQVQQHMSFVMEYGTGYVGPASASDRGLKIYLPRFFSVLIKTEADVARIENMLANADPGSRGWIGRREFASILKRIGKHSGAPKLSRVDFEKLVRSLDHLYNGRIAYNDLVRSLRRMLRKIPSPVAPSSFAPVAVVEEVDGVEEDEDAIVGHEPSVSRRPDNGTYDTDMHQLLDAEFRALASARSFDQDHDTPPPPPPPPEIVTPKVANLDHSYTSNLSSAVKELPPSNPRTRLEVELEESSKLRFQDVIRRAEYFSERGEVPPEIMSPESEIGPLRPPTPRFCRIANESRKKVAVLLFRSIPNRRRLSKQRNSLPRLWGLIAGRSAARLFVL